MTIARTGRPFDGPQREMLRYLAGQAAVSLENIELHELVSQGSLTDELTGLADSRHLRELLEAEVERAERFGHELSMIVLSLDRAEHAKQTRGPDRDRVLREVARIIDAASHGMGEPGRWGTEELAVLLPETGVEGALDLAERIRIAIERAEIRLAQGDETSGVTVSIGIAALARFGDGSERLVASAAAALDRARAGGGDRTETASRAESAARA